MSVNKYVGDYRIIEDVDEKGRIRTSTEYIGDDYYYRLEADTRKKTTLAVCACVIAEWVLWVVALVPYSTVMQHVYVSLPFVFALVPLFMLTGVAWDLFRKTEPLEHRHADRVQNRYPACSAIGGLLVAVALIASGISLAMTGRVEPGDIVFCVCALAIVGASAFVYSKRESFAMRAEKPRARLEESQAE